ncbi:dGTP triphosphohydrolase [Archangium violaceum]|uniref:dGTP triphosphohydrolase n=1 Tax=Archangium violaceum TaxID=83451 RepID=UPI000A042544|nr:dNTP triphosphohydrolase [Archangium violaceum]
MLCTKRIRELRGGRPSTRAAQDVRTEFDRDYDRAVFSTPVRRLQDKTQVFPLEPNDAVRTRLTHSLEVSTLTRGVVRAVVQRLFDRKHISQDQAFGIEAIAATCGLIHDIGNPPFGHAGERAISSWFKKKLEQDPAFFKGLDEHPQAAQLRGDFLEFEGNAQTLRIVSKLQLLADRHGLNLTVGTLSAAMKYTAASHEMSKVPHEKEKPGYFASEQDVVDIIREQTGTGTARNPIAYLVEACDDTIYATVDIEDGIKKGVISWQALEQALKAEANSSETRALIEKHLKDASDYIQGEPGLDLSGKALDEARAQLFRTGVIATTKEAVIQSFDANYDAIMSGSYPGELISDSAAKGLIDACKEVGRRHIYRADQTLRLEVLGRRVIHDLMDIFWEGASSFGHPPPEPQKFARKFEGKIYNLLSHNYRAVFENALESSKLPTRYHQFQLVTDYVCGMTDTFACKLHAELTNG